jgi:potassium-dependent mechanosensitive channel
VCLARRLLSVRCCLCIWRRGKWLGLRPGERTSLLPWLYALTVIAVWVVFVFGLLDIWRFPEATVVQIRRYLLDGFKVGSVDVVPLRIYGSVAVFASLFALSAWIRGRLESRWLIDSTMDRGAREAVVTITGYTGIILSVVIALSVAGVGFGNLALIAGALSVGIGFGLQNIVNNFISGLILLFERPIKTGDWIVVGNTEGYVRSIRIRSTQIQTFDRADVIVPNSELIAGQVTNWMLRDPRGRVRLPIGVAYGSDTQKVREILLEVAKAHVDVIDDGSVPGPRVLFREFGDSSLNFELRAFIRNIDNRINVISDLNFAIDAAFRERGVEIPFPQRDVHIRDIKGLAEALRKKE